MDPPCIRFVPAAACLANPIRFHQFWHVDSGPSIRQLSELSKGRLSHSDCRYFITFCVNGRRRVPTDAVALRIKSEALMIESDAAVGQSTLMIMPDHVHWLFSLGQRLTLGQVVARLKAKTRPVLATRGAAWQPNYFEHRLRIEEDRIVCALYVP
jgi:putative transposase